MDSMHAQMTASRVYYALEQQKQHTMVDSNSSITIALRSALGAHAENGRDNMTATPSDPGSAHSPDEQIYEHMPAQQRTTIRHIHSQV
jgi:hypothetical protein